MVEKIHLKYRTYTLKNIGIENVITEFFGKVCDEETPLTGLIAIEFDDVSIEYEGGATENIGGKMLSMLFLDAMRSFKKPPKNPKIT